MRPRQLRRNAEGIPIALPLGKQLRPGHMEVVGYHRHGVPCRVYARLLQKRPGQGKIFRCVLRLLLQDQSIRVHTPGGEPVIHASGLADLLAVACPAGEHRRDLRMALQIRKGRVQAGSQRQ